MPAIAVKGSMGSGHGNFPPRASVEGDPTMTINGKPVQVDGDLFPSHTDGHTSHVGYAVASSNWMTVDGKAVCVVGDRISCGSTIATGDSLMSIG